MENKEYKKITLEMRNKLRLALPEKACKKHPTKSFLTSINPMYVIERLNDVFGVGSWHVKNDVILSDINQGSIVVKVTLEIPEYNIYLEQFGGNDNGGKDKKGFDLGDCFKGACTDGLTKLASYLEIGISIYQNQGNISNFVDYTEDEKIEAKKIDFLNKIRKTLGELKNSGASLTKYHEYIKVNLTDKHDWLAKNDRFISIVELFTPEPEIIINKAVQTINKIDTNNQSCMDKCDKCFMTDSYCTCDIDKKVLAKV